MSDGQVSAIHQRALVAADGFRKAEADLLDALAAVEDQHVFRAMGYPSLFIYATQALRLSESVAFSMIMVMRKAREVPELRARIASGDLSVSVAKKVVSALKPENQSVWLEKATSLTARQLEKEVVRENPRAATLEATLEQITEFYLKHKDPVRKAERVVAKKGLNTQVSVPASKPQPEPKPDADGSREPRSPPPRPNIRTSLPAPVEHSANLRDQGKCQAKLPNGSPSHAKRWIELHHIQPVAQGGKHELKNLITLCSFHHKQAHSQLKKGA